VTSEVRQRAREIPGVLAIEKCIVRKMGYQYFVDMHVEVDPEMTVARGHEIAHQVKDHVMAQLPKIRDVLVHIEPSNAARSSRVRASR
jgi:divalent metal cation (Fe/Co/Zn/Cd) transporter